MASIIIRNLPEDIKQKLRQEAAKNQCSMEEQARRWLGDGANFAEDKAKQVDVPKNNTQSNNVVYDNEVGVDLQSMLSNNQKEDSVLYAQTLKNKNILLIIGGGIAAYKSLDLIRRLKERGAIISIILTKAAQNFITPLAASALSGNNKTSGGKTSGKVYSDLFGKDEEHDIGHIRLARNADLIIIAPATASRIAKMAHGIGDDLAGAVLLASDALKLVVPAMNPYMYRHKATQRNIAQLGADGCLMLGPEYGEMAEAGEKGLGRMSAVEKIVVAAENILNDKPKPLINKHIIITSGPTHEPIDPVRYIANRSSGKQGHALAQALANLGAKVTLISGPVHLPDPFGVAVKHVETARQMMQAVEAALPADCAIFVAAVADWRSAIHADKKIKKDKNNKAPILPMVENPDILATIGKSAYRPKLVIGFAAETDDLIKNAKIKVDKKGADYIIANDISYDKNGISVMGGEENTVHFISHDAVESWPKMTKTALAEKIADRIAEIL